MAVEIMTEDEISILEGPIVGYEPADEPTVKEWGSFNPKMDATLLYESMKGLGTREKTIIDLLSNRSSGQRQKIAAEYKHLYGKEVISAMKGELKILISGHFEDVIIALFKSPEVFDAEQIHHAINLPISDEDMLITILCSRSNEEIYLIKTAYTTLYERELTDDITLHVHTSAYFKNLLQAILAANRGEGAMSSSDISEKDLDQIMQTVEQAKWDARALYDISPKRWATDATFIPMFATRSYTHLQIVFEELEKLIDQDTEKIIAREIHGDVGKFLESLVKFIKNKHAYFAEVLYKTMKGLGTNDRKLIHTVVTRCDKDLGNIKVEFEKKYKKTLESFIVGDTSGYYRNILLALSGYQPHKHDH